MHCFDEIQKLCYTNPSGQNGDVRNKADVLHQLLSLPERIQAKHRQTPLTIGQTQHGLEQGSLAGAIRADQTGDLAFFDVEADVVYRPDAALRLGDVAGADHASHSFSP